MPIHPTEPPGKVRTKIVATLGPASRAPELIRELLAAGVDVFRLNFSHGSQDEHSETLRSVRTIAGETSRAVAILQDLGGPKIRLGRLPGDAVECRTDETFTLTAATVSEDPGTLTCTYPEVVDDLKPGDPVLFADGAVAMVVTARKDGAAELRVTLPGRLKSHQGINLPGVALKIAALTAKDLADLDWTARNDVDYVGLSFVRRADDVARLRDELDRRGSRARIVAKIEKPEALDDLDAIVEMADAVMVARGDLGVEMDVAQVPAAQKRIIAACHRARIPVITATQMLSSMEQSNRPTRAEASDVFNAVLDGTDAVMLSGETAVGSYPVEVVTTMSRIATEAEALLLTQPGAGLSLAGGPAAGTGRAAAIRPITEAVVEAAGLVSRRLAAALVVVATHSGRTALALSKQRFGSPTIALTDDPAVARAMALYWGVTPLSSPDATNAPEALALALGWARERALVNPGDRVVLVRGTLPDDPTHNGMLVEEIR